MRRKHMKGIRLMGLALTAALMVGITLPAGCSTATPEESAPPSDSTVPIREEEPTPKSIFAQNFLYSSYTFESFALTLGGLDGYDLVISSGDLSIDMRADAPFSIGGHISISYRGVEETLAVSFIDGVLTLRVKGQYISIQASTLLDIYGAIRSFLPALPDLQSLVDGSVLDPVIGALGMDLSQILTLLRSALVLLMSETVTSTGYTYSLSLGGYGSISLHTDSSSVLTAIETVTPLTIGGITSMFSGADAGESALSDLTFSLEAVVSEASRTANLVEEISGGTSTDIGSLGEGLVDTLYYLNEDPSIRADYAFTYDSPSLSTIKRATGEILMDIDDITSPLTSGKFRITLDEGGFTDRDVMAAYEDGYIYLEAGDVVKGRISGLAVADIVDQIQALIGDDDASSSIDAVERILISPAFTAATNLLESLKVGSEFSSADIAALKSIFAYVNFAESSVSVGLDAASMGLGNGTVDLSLAFDPGQTLALTEISITGIPLGDATVGFSADLSHLDTYTPLDPSQYKDYSSLVALPRQISGILDDRRIAADYSVSLFGIDDLSDGFTLDGSIAADLSGSSISSVNDLLKGDFYISASTLLEGTSHSVEARLIDGTAYFSVDEILKNSVSAATASDLIGVISTRLGLSGDTGDSLNDVTSTFTDILEAIETSLTENIYDSETMTVKLSKIADYVSIDKDNDDGSRILVSLDTALLGIDTGLVEISLIDGEISTISAIGLPVSSGSANISVSLKDFWDFTLSDEEKEEYPDVGNLPALATGIFDIAQGELTQYGVSVEATLLKPDTAYPMTLRGKAMVDGDRAQGEIYVDLDQYTYDIDVKFSYNDPESAAYDLDGNLSNRLLVSYNGSINLSMSNTSLNSVVDMVLGSLSSDGESLSSALSLASTLGSMDSDTYATIDSILATVLNGGIQRITFADDSVTVTLSPSLLGLDDEDPIVVTIEYDSDSSSVERVSLDGTFSGNEVSAEIELTSFDETYSVGLSASASYIDLDSLPLLIQTGMNTIGDDCVNFRGTLMADSDLVGFDVTSTLEVGYGLVQSDTNPQELEMRTYIGIYSIKNSNYSYTDILQLNDEGDMLVANYDGQEQTEMVRLTYSEFNRTMTWWLMGYGLDMQQCFVQYVGYIGGKPLFYSQITSAIISSLTGDSAGTSEDVDYGGIFGTFIVPEKLLNNYTYSTDGSTDSYAVTLNLGSIDLKALMGSSLANFISLNSVTINITASQDSDGNVKIDRIYMNSTDVVSFISLANLTVSFNLYRADNPHMDRYQKVLDTFTSRGGFDLGYYYLTSYSDSQTSLPWHGTGTRRHYIALGTTNMLVISGNAIGTP